jgi:ankyrin repeat protein
MAAANGHLDIAKLLLDHGAVSVLSFLVKLDVLHLLSVLLALPFRVETLGCTKKRAKVWYPYI